MNKKDKKKVYLAHGVDRWLPTQPALRGTLEEKG